MKDWIQYALAVAGAIILVLLGQYTRSIEHDLDDAKARSGKQWQQAAETERCLRDKISDLKAEVAEIRGFHRGQDKKP